MSQDPLIRRRQAQLREKIHGDPILSDQIVPFLSGGTWANDGDGVVTAEYEAGPGVVRVLEVERHEVRLGRQGFPERKRIPLA